jgi:mannose-1-phosphate guanylyltransferase
MDLSLNHYYAVIMAGGGGTRLWPLSRQIRPKQMLSLFDERTLFQTSVNRIAELFPFERIFVVTVAEQAGELRQQAPEIPPGNFIIEPEPKGTASVIGLAAVILQQLDPDAVMVVLTSDHYIGNEPEFRSLLSAAYRQAQNNYLVTLGIEPTFPAVGFGYIQRGESIRTSGGREVFQVKRFKEKPSESQAKAMLETGDHTWNSGMFTWKTKLILDEFSRQMPEFFNQLSLILAECDPRKQKTVIESCWQKIKNETIDYGIMENARNVVVIPAANLEWNDVGSWDSLFDVIRGDEHGNIVMGGAHIGLDTQDSLVYMNQKRRLIVTIGVNDLIVVDTGDVLLVCRKDQAQRVRQVVNQLRENGQEYV